MPNFLTPHEAIKTLLQVSRVSSGNAGEDFDWNNMPYYKEAPEGSGDFFPYCVFDVAASSVEHTMGSGYTEDYDIDVMVVALEHQIRQLSSPYNQPSLSVFAYLDSLNAPEAFNGDYFQVTRFMRKSYELQLDPNRSPGTQQVWIAKASYNMQIGTNYPLPDRTGRP